MFKYFERGSFINLARNPPYYTGIKPSTRHRAYPHTTILYRGVSHSSGLVSGLSAKEPYSNSFVLQTINKYSSCWSRYGSISTYRKRKKH